MNKSSVLYLTLALLCLVLVRDIVMYYDQEALVTTRGSCMLGSLTPSQKYTKKDMQNLPDRSNVVMGAMHGHVYPVEIVKVII